MCPYVGRQLGVGLESVPHLRLEGGVREHLSDQTLVAGLGRRQLLVEQQHLTGLGRQRQRNTQREGRGGRQKMCTNLVNLDCKSLRYIGNHVLAISNVVSLT